MSQQFEGMLLQMMLKSMRDATPQDGPMDNEQTRFFTSIMDQQLAQNLSSKGVLGFAKMIEQQLGRNMASERNDATSSSLEVLKQAMIERQVANSAVSLSSGGAERVRNSLSANIEPALPLQLVFREAL